jgi:hypothetical protein
MRPLGVVALPRGNRRRYARTRANRRRGGSQSLGAIPASGRRPARFQSRISGERHQLRAILTESERHQRTARLARAAIDYHDASTTLPVLHPSLFCLHHEEP